MRDILHTTQPVYCPPADCKASIHHARQLCSCLAHHPAYLEGHISKPEAYLLQIFLHARRSRSVEKPLVTVLENNMETKVCRPNTIKIVIEYVLSVAKACLPGTGCTWWTIKFTKASRSRINEARRGPQEEPISGFSFFYFEPPIPPYRSTAGLRFPVFPTVIWKHTTPNRTCLFPNAYRLPVH